MYTYIYIVHIGRSSAYGRPLAQMYLTAPPVQSMSSFPNSQPPSSTKKKA